MLTNRQLFIASIAIVLLSIGLVFAFTSPQSNYFSTSGQIGDTIGGICSPLFNLIGAILIYISFREQYKANQLLSTTKEFSNIENLLQEINKEIDKLEFGWIITGPLKENSKKIKHNGFDAIIVFSDKLIEWGAEKNVLYFSRDLLYVLEIVEFTSLKINNYTFISTDKDFFL